MKQRRSFASGALLLLNLLNSSIPSVLGFKTKDWINGNINRLKGTILLRDYGVFATEQCDRIFNKIFLPEEIAKQKFRSKFNKSSSRFMIFLTILFKLPSLPFSACTLLALSSKEIVFVFWCGTFLYWLEVHSLHHLLGHENSVLFSATTSNQALNDGWRRLTSTENVSNRAKDKMGYWNFC